MTDLSPAAQAVLDAADAVLEKGNAPTWIVARGIAAALRAVANQVVPPHLETELYDRNPSLTLQKAVEIRHQLLTIANELENTHD
jgi:hypothetical protein